MSIYKYPAIQKVLFDPRTSIGVPGGLNTFVFWDAGVNTYVFQKTGLSHKSWTLVDTFDSTTSNTSEGDMLREAFTSEIALHQFIVTFCKVLTNATILQGDGGSQELFLHNFDQQFVHMTPMFIAPPGHHMAGAWIDGEGYFDFQYLDNNRIRVTNRGPDDIPIGNFKMVVSKI